MKTGKVPESILKRSVLKQIKKNKAEVIKGAAVGTDCAFVHMEGSLTGMGVASAADEGIKTAAHAIYRASNNLAAEGIRAVAVTLHLMLPPQYEEADLKELMKQAQTCADALELQIAGGQTEVLPHLTGPVVSVSAIGTPMAGLQGDDGKQRALTGSHIVMSKWTGISGTSLLANQKESKLKEQYPEYFVKAAQSLEQYYSVMGEAAVAVKSGVSFMHDVAGGGVFGALWELGESLGSGLTVSLKKIPVKQETIEVCEFFDINPYELRSDGSLLMVAEDGYTLCDILIQAGIPATVIGEITDSNDKIIMNDDEKRFLEPPKGDELYKIL